MNKRVLRKFAIPSNSPNPKNGIFCADQVKYVVRTAIKNIDHQRTLVLYIYAKESVLAGNHTPRWTMFQQKGGYITLCTDDKGTRWQQSMFENLGKDYFFRDKCSFYSQADERRVTRYCQSEKQKGFESLCLFQLDLLRKKQRENELKKQRRIIERMKPVGALPRDIKGFMHRETLPHYIFYDYAKGKAPKNAYCTACKHNVSVAEAKHNGEGVCPHCKRKITFKSRGRRGYIVDRSTAQVIQRLGSNEMIIRFVKAYRRYPKSDTSEFHVYENARLFLQWDGSKIIASESYYYGYSRDRITPWHPGDRPVFSRWYYNFEADCCGYLYHRNLDSELKGTPWQYSALKEYYAGDPTPLYAGQYLQKYLRYPIDLHHKSSAHTSWQQPCSDAHRVSWPATIAKSFSLLCSTETCLCNSRCAGRLKHGEHMGVFHLCGLFKSRGSWAGAKRSHCNARTAHLLGNGFAEAAYKFLRGIV